MSEEKLDEIIADIDLIKKALKIVPDKDTKITDFDSSIESYEEFAGQELKLEQNTIDNQKSAILGFLNHSKGIINKQTVKEYLDSNESESWKTNRVKALRRYLRDYLKLGRWIEEFSFAKPQAKPFVIPNDEKLVEFCSLLSYQVQTVFLFLFNSGMRISEVLSLRFNDIDYKTNMINAYGIHKGKTKSSWISFITKQTADFLDDYTWSSACPPADEENSRFFSVSARTVQNEFKQASEKLGITVNPHLMRKVFTNKCKEAGIQNEFIDAFCGRTPQSVLSKHYLDYSPESLRKQYEKVEPYLILDLN